MQFALGRPVPRNRCAAMRACPVISFENSQTYLLYSGDFFYLYWQGTANNCGFVIFENTNNTIVSNLNPNKAHCLNLSI
jgi:hypothetical protein